MACHSKFKIQSERRHWAGASCATATLGAGNGSRGNERPMSIGIARDKSIDVNNTCSLAVTIFDGDGGPQEHWYLKLEA